MSRAQPSRPLSERLRDGAAHPTSATAAVAAPARVRPDDALAVEPTSLDRLNAAVAELRTQASRPYVFHALAAFDADDLDTAVDLLLKALDLDETCGPAWHLLGVCRERAGDFTSALKAYEEALKATPDEPELANDIGRLACAMGMKAEAEALFLKYLQMKPGTADGLNNLACAQRDQLRFGDAVETLKAALALHPTSPVLWNTIGTVMAEVGDLTHSLSFFDEALRIDPGFTKARYNRGNARLEQGDAAGALADCEGALAETRVASDRAMMTLAQATMLLALGRLAQGWEAYRVRNAADFVDVAHFLCEAPPWEPDTDVRGKSVLVFGEQGLGDEVLFANALPDLLADVGPEGVVHLAVEPRLVGLFQRSFPQAKAAPHATWKVDHHIVRTAPALADGPAPDCWLPIGDLMRRYRPDVAAFPDTPAFLHPDPQRVADMRAALAALPPGLNVGVVWKSLRITSGRHRFYSAFEAWEPVLRTTGVNFVSLQYGDAAADIAYAAEAFGATVHEIAGLDMKDDLEGVAALGCALDLSIGPANASTNLAAASGGATWLISTPCAWPRLGEDTRYPWYPAARVFAPAVADDWGAVMAEVAGALGALARA